MVESDKVDSSTMLALGKSSVTEDEKLDRKDLSPYQALPAARIALELIPLSEKQQTIAKPLDFAL